MTASLVQTEKHSLSSRSKVRCSCVNLLAHTALYFWSGTFTIHLHESIRPGRDWTRDPWICSQTRICSKTHYRRKVQIRFCFCSVSLKSSSYFTEDRTSLPRKAIGPKRSNYFSRRVRTSISKAAYSHLWFSWGIWTTCPPLPLDPHIKSKQQWIIFFPTCVTVVSTLLKEKKGHGVGAAPRQ